MFFIHCIDDCIFIFRQHYFSVYAISTFILICIGLIILFLPTEIKSTTPIQKTRHKKIENKNEDDVSQDVTGIASGDIFTTQLDLARAYVDMGMGDSIQNMLLTIQEKGNATQRKTAKQLLSRI